MTKRKKLPVERPSLTHKFNVAGHKGYITVGLYEDGQPGEVFLTVAKEGSTIRGLMDCVGILTSVALQHGVPLSDLTRKLRGVTFEPAGFTGGEEIKSASSPVDYVFHWLDVRFNGG